MSIKRKRVKLLLPDASPLISLAHGGEDCLELIFKAKLPVVMTDQVLFEATYRKDEFQDAAVIDRWYRKHKAQIKVIVTKIGEARRALESVGKYDHKKFADQGEESVLQAIKSKHLDPGPYLFLFEDEQTADPSFFGVYPVHVVSTYGLLVGLERAHVIPSADIILERIRLGGRHSLKADIIDRPTRKVRDPEEESEWIPKPGAPVP